MNWHLGMEIVCVKTHSEGRVRKGKVYTIKALKQVCCGIIIDVGIRDFSGATEYGWICLCGRKGRQGNDTTIWIHESLFQPLEYNQEAIEELLEQKLQDKCKQ